MVGHYTKCRALLSKHGVLCDCAGCMSMKLALSARLGKLIYPRKSQIWDFIWREQGLYFIVFYIFWLRHAAYGILVLRPGIEPMPSAVEAWSHKHWTASEFLAEVTYHLINIYILMYSIAGMYTQSCPTLCHPLDCSQPGSSVHRILQASIMEWVAISSSGGSPQPKD